MIKEKTISLIVPCYNEEESLDKFIHQVLLTQEAMQDVFLEILFINDGSTDGTLSHLKRLVKEFPERINYLSFSRNFGKEAAIIAGLDHALGQWVALMDVDLQDPPHLLIQMYEMVADQGYDVAAACRTNRTGEPLIRSWFATLFYKLNNLISEVKLVEGARDFRLMNRKVVDAIRQLPEHNRFSKGLFAWVGFDVAYISYPHVDRYAGQSSWSFHKLFDYALEGIISFSDMPLTIASLLGLLAFLLAAGLGIAIIVKTLLFGDPTPGWPSLAVLVVGMGGLQLLCLGIIGKYISKLYIESKNRPLYLIKEAHFVDQEDFNSLQG